MAYCQHCGAAVTSDARFCAYCGAALQTTVENVVVPQPVIIHTEAQTAVGDYSVILLSLGRCGRSAAIRLITAACGYSTEEAVLLVDAVPVTLAQNLPRVQAVCLAQALTEKGMEVSLRDSSGYQELIETDDEIIFDKLGNFITSAAAALGLIGARHRIPRTAIRRLDIRAIPERRPPVLRVQHRHPVPEPPKPKQPVRHAVQHAQPVKPVPHQPQHAQPAHQPRNQPTHAQQVHTANRQRPGSRPEHDGPGRRDERR